MPTDRFPQIRLVRLRSCLANARNGPPGRAATSLYQFLWR